MDFNTYDVQMIFMEYASNFIEMSKIICSGTKPDDKSKPFNLSERLLMSLSLYTGAYYFGPIHWYLSNIL